MALEVAEWNADTDELLLVGIWENGFHIAKKIHEHLSKVFNGRLQLLECRIDKKHPLNVQFSDSVDFNGRSVLLIDDVANSGRTMLYALKPLLQQLPRQIETLALVERTHKKFPLHVDYIGLSVSTSPNENIVVEVNEGEILGAYMR